MDELLPTADSQALRQPAVEEKEEVWGLNYNLGY